MIAFAYYGAKNLLLPELLPLLPECDHYVEPFCGSATVLLNRIPSPIETMNDINGDIVNFFRILREHPDQIVENLWLTPYSHQEFEQAWEFSDCPIERARRFFIRTQMDLAKAGHRKDKSWSKNKKYVAGGHSYAVKNFAAKVPGLLNVAERLKMTQIENISADIVLKKYDSPDTLFYCDPPYLPATRNSSNDYRFELTLKDHEDLQQILNNVNGRVALSGYSSPEMKRWYKGWRCHKFIPRKVPMARGSGLVRQECLWTNYDPYHQKGQLKLFDYAKS